MAEVMDRQVRFNTDAETYERLEQIAKRDKVSLSLVMRELIEMGIDARESWERAPKLQLPEGVKE